MNYLIVLAMLANYIEKYFDIFLTWFSTVFACGFAVFLTLLLAKDFLLGC